MFELCLSRPTRAPVRLAPLSFCPQSTGVHSMLLTKAAIGSRAFSNGNASRKKFAGGLKQTLIIQGFGRIKKNDPVCGEAANSVSFCAWNKIIASAKPGVVLLDCG